jgi:hypothetical protein
MHGFRRRGALKASCLLDSRAKALFEVLLDFKFGNDSLTAAAIRELCARGMARVFSP